MLSGLFSCWRAKADIVEEDERESEAEEVCNSLAIQHIKSQLQIGTGTASLETLCVKVLAKSLLLSCNQKLARHILSVLPPCLIPRVNMQYLAFVSKSKSRFNGKNM